MSSPFIAIITTHNPSQRQQKKLCLISFIVKIFMSFVVSTVFSSFRKCLSRTAQSTFYTFFFLRIPLLKYHQNTIWFCYACWQLTKLFCSLNCAYQLNHKCEAQQMLQNHAIRYRNFLIAPIQPALYENCRLQKIKILP